MGIRAKTIIIILAVGALTTGIFYVASRAVLMERYSLLEEQAIRATAERVRSRVTNDLELLKMLTWDWGIWDDAYHFMAEPDESFVDNNFPLSVYQQFDLNLVAYVDLDGRLLYGRSYDTVTQTRNPPIESARQLVDAARLAASSGNVTGVWKSPAGAGWLFSAVPVIDSGETEPARGTFVIGRLLDKHWIQKLSTVEQVDVSLHSVGAAGDFVELGSKTVREAIAVDTRGPDYATAGWILSDIEDEPAYQLQVALPRTFHQEGRQMLVYLLGALLFLSLIFAATVYWLLDRLVLRRILQIQNGVRLIRRAEDLAPNLPVQGHDEVARLGDELNKMLQFIGPEYDHLTRNVESRTRQLKAALERIQSETRERENAQQALGHAEKLAATGRMAARLSHEINNPLAGIRNAFQLIKGAIPETHAHFDYVDIIDSEIEHLALKVRQMANLYRAGPQEEVVDLSELLAEVTDMLERSLRGRSIQIDKQVELREPIKLNASVTRQVLFDVLEQAIEFAPPSAVIAVAASMDDRMLVLSVSGPGPGLQDKHARAIFRPLVVKDTADPIGDPMGDSLGLSVTRSLIEGIGGVLTFDALHDRTTFHIQVPANVVPRMLRAMT